MEAMSQIMPNPIEVHKKIVENLEDKLDDK